MVEWKINKIESTREDEFYVTLWVDHRFEPDRPVPMWEKKEKLDKGEDTRWFNVGAFHVDECFSLLPDEGINVAYRVNGPHPIIPFTNRTKFDPQTESYGLNCGALRTRSQQQYYVGVRML